MSFEDILPGEPISSPKYNYPPKDRYIIDYVPPTDPDGFIGELEASFHSFFVWIINIIWNGYLFFVELVIRIVNIVFDVNMWDKIFKAIDEMMPALITSVWDKLLFFVFSTGIIGAGIYYTKGRDNKSIQSIGTVLLLMVFGPIILKAVPSGLSLTDKTEEVGFHSKMVAMKQ